MRTIILLIIAFLGFAFSDVTSLDTFLQSVRVSGITLSQHLGNLTHSDPNPPELQQGWDGSSPIPADELSWCRAVAKGTTLLNAMSYSDADAGQTFSPPRTTAQSDWSLSDLAPWGYNVFDAENKDYCEYSSTGYWGFANFFQHMGISTKCSQDGGLWKVTLVAHAQEGDGHVDDQVYRGPDGRIRRQTSAEFYIGTNERQGGIIAFKRYGPRERGNDMIPPVPLDQMPPLQASSDIMWTLWESVTPEFSSNINFFMTLAIENKDTLRILKRALNQRNSDLSRAGFVFDMTTEEGKAILGSPNCIGFAYFLLQHKAQLGKKIIASAHVMECETARKSPCIFLGVGQYLEHRKPPSAQVVTSTGGPENDLINLNRKYGLLRTHKLGI